MLQAWLWSASTLMRGLPWCRRVGWCRRCGFFASVPEASDSVVKVVDTVGPNPAWQQAYDELYGVYRGLYPALKESFHRLVAPQ